MRKTKKFLMWFYMLTKKHLYRWSFPVLLVLIIISSPIISRVLSADEGILDIALFPGEDTVAKEISDELIGEDSIINYTLSDTFHDAVEAVKKGKCDGAWIFSENFFDGLIAHTEENFSKPLITVIEREENIALMLSREKLYGKIFPHITHNMYKKYIREKIGGEDKITDEEIERIYRQREREGNLIEIRSEGSGVSYDAKSESLLLSPLRGFLSILIMLCGLSAGLYFVKERNEKIYSWLPEGRHYIPALGSCIGAVFLASIAGFFSLWLSGMLTKAWWEFLCMFLFELCTGLFSAVICTFVKNESLYGALIVPIVIVILIMCPIFFNVKFVVWPKFLLPNYYYLMSIYNREYLFYMLIYSFVLTGLLRVPKIKAKM